MSDKRGIGTLVNDQIEMNSSRFDYFTPIIPENILQSSTTLEINPSTNESPYEFQIPRDPEQFTDLTLTRLSGVITCRKLNANSREVEPWGANEAISVCNLFPHSIFKQVDVLVENTQINDVSTATYPYKAFIECVLSYNNDAKKTHLKGAGWEKDTTGQENVSGDANQGWVARRAAVIGQDFHFNMKLHCDFLHSMKYLPPGLSLTLRLIRNDANFSLMGDAFNALVRIDISKLRLQYTRVRAEPSFTKTVVSNMTKQTALFPLTQSKIRTFLVNAGTDRINYPNIYTDVLPKTVIIGFLDRRAINGDMRFNPFRFNHHNINLLNLMINNVPVHPTRPFQPNYLTGDFLREYINLFEETGMKQGNNIVDISMEDFKNSCNWYAYDLTPDKCNQEHAHAARHGNISIELGFREAPTENLYMLIYTTHRQTIEIDSNKNVIVHD